MVDQSNGKDGTTTAIGPSIVIRGKLKSSEDLVVKGRIEAEITSSKALFVENSGIIKANLKVHSAKVSGVVVGNITAEQKLEIAQDGRVIGDLMSPRIVLNDGAAFKGNIDMQTFDTPRVNGPTSSYEAPKTAAPAEFVPPPSLALGASEETSPEPSSREDRGGKRRR
jgi:cytoskeletal protein CcmA (bactofilin family)